MDRDIRAMDTEKVCSNVGIIDITALLVNGPMKDIAYPSNIIDQTISDPLLYVSLCNTETSL